MSYSRLSIKTLELHINLGWSDKERLEKQTISMDVDIVYAATPKACVSDHLEDTVCYSHLVHELKNSLEQKTYHLIEHLCHHAYQVLKKSLNAHDKIRITVLKHPNIIDLTGGVAFSFGDDLS